MGEDGNAAFSSRESVAGASADVKSSASRCQKIVLKDIRVGRYVLRVEARLLGAGANPVSRETPVMVLP